MAASSQQPSLKTCPAVRLFALRFRVFGQGPDGGARHDLDNKRLAEVLALAREPQASYPPNH